MKWILLILLPIVLGSSGRSHDTEYVYTNFVDHMTMTFQADNRYTLVISSCTFHIKCEGQYVSHGDSLFIKSKKVKENVGGFGENEEHWKRTYRGKRIGKKYFESFST